jgi:hypothetical protein
MVTDYVIYKFEKVKVATVALDASVKGWLDAAVRSRGLLPLHLKDRGTYASYGENTGNFLICDPSDSPEIPLLYVEMIHRPSWTLPENSSTKWLEDDATISHPDHEDVRAAYARLFKELPIEPLVTWNADDTVYKLFPRGRVVIESCPGNSSIRLLNEEL